MSTIVEYSTPAEGQEDHIDLLEYWGILRRRWRLFAGTAIATVFLALVFTLLATPSYRAGTTLQIERDTMKVVSFEAIEPTESPLDRDFYQTQYELLKSESLAKRVIEDLRMIAEPTYEKYVEAADEDAEERADGKPVNNSLRRQLREDAVVKPVLEALSIEPIRNSRLVRVNFDSPDPGLSAKVANAYATAFIASNLERRFQASSYAKKYLEERLAQLKDRLEDSERQVVAFSAQEHIVSVSDDKPSLDAQSLSDLNAALATAQGARMKAEALWQRASEGDGMALPQVVGNLLIQKLREQKAAMEANYQNSLATFKPGYPNMRQLQQQIAEANRQGTATMPRRRRDNGARAGASPGRILLGLAASALLAFGGWCLLRVDTQYGPALGPDRILADAGNLRPTMMEARAHAALRDRPVDGTAFRMLGIAAARRGASERAQELYRIAVRRDPRDWQAHAFLMDEAFRRGAAGEGIEHLDAILRVEPGLGEALLQALAPDLDDVSLRTALVDSLVADPPWTGRMMSILMAPSTDPAIAAEVIEDLSTRRPLAPLERSALIDTLARAGRPGAARTTWLQSLGPRERALAGSVRSS
ncbi:GumC family protein [Lysobacter changpingensis]|uniref:GumC family protein n=1 Tax=Lysobacter changpingensis TaxID=2792784 RepID=UPI001A90C708|nr:GumC family protein [Lysobacter changpingensis]